MSTEDRTKYKPNTKCQVCGKEYYRFPYEIKNGVKLCCSSKCKGKAQQVYHEPNSRCAVCGKLFYRRPNKIKSKSGLYFCSKKCQNTGYKQGIVVPGPKKENKFCKTCGKLLSLKNKTGHCVKCWSKVRYTNITQEQKQKWSETTKKLMAEGKIKPWQSRNILSYPEKFFKKVLENNNIKFEGPNYVIKQQDLGVPNCLPSACYFLDFKIGNVDLEIDGKQHSYSDRKESDKVRDEYLTKAGYTVYRIKWKSINTKSGKQYIKNEIDKFLKFLNYK